MTRGDPNRTFHYAVLVSLALHAVLLLSFPDLVSRARRVVENLAPPIVARLIAPEPASAPPAQERTPPPEEKKRPAAKKPPPAPRPVQNAAPPKVVEPAPVAKPVTTPEVEPVATPSSAPDAAPATETAEPAPTPAPVASAPAAPPGAQSGAPPRDARTIGEYRLELIEAARRIKDRTRYPPIARDNNWTGQTQVRVTLAASGAPAISVKGTSGHPVLDQHALSIFRQAAREVSLPPDLRGKEFAVEVWMDFTLTP